MRKVTKLLLFPAIALAISTSTFAKDVDVHQTNITNYFLGNLTIGVTLYTGSWHGQTCSWQHGYALTNFDMKMGATYIFKLDVNKIIPVPTMVSPTCGELRFVTNHGVQESDKFKILLGPTGIPKNTDPNTTNLKFFG